MIRGAGRIAAPVCVGVLVLGHLSQTGDAPDTGSALAVTLFVESTEWK